MKTIYLPCVFVLQLLICDLISIALFFKDATKTLKNNKGVYENFKKVAVSKICELKSNVLQFERNSRKVLNTRIVEYLKSYCILYQYGITIYINQCSYFDS